MKEEVSKVDSTIVPLKSTVYSREKTVSQFPEFRKQNPSFSSWFQDASFVANHQQFPNKRGTRVPRYLSTKFHLGVNSRAWASTRGTVLLLEYLSTYMLRPASKTSQWRHWTYFVQWAHWIGQCAHWTKICPVSILGLMQTPSEHTGH
jgi:hypothetical protein